MNRPFTFAWWFLALACGRGAAEPARPTVPPVTSAAAVGIPALNEPTTPTATPYKVECQGNETRAEGQRFVGDGATHKAHLAIWPPGDTSVEYDFDYERGDVVFALYRVVGYAGDFKHTIEYRYSFRAGEPLQCLRKDAKGSEAEVAAQLPDAENKKDDCRFAAKTLALGNALKLGDGNDDTLTKLACAL
jgi:hypothetical protein